jgi:hypothetical protein
MEHGDHPVIFLGLLNALIVLSPNAKQFYCAHARSPIKSTARTYMPNSKRGPSYPVGSLRSPIPRVVHRENRSYLACPAISVSLRMLRETLKSIQF